MATPADTFPELLHDAVNGGAEITLEELFKHVTFASAGLLDRLQELRGFLDQYRLRLKPDIISGDFGDMRLLVYGATQVSFAERLVHLRQSDELVDVEFKSTAFVALRDLREGRPPRECLTEGVLHSLLKAICAFLNKDGGEIYVGVESGGDLCGIQPDLLAMPPADQSFDKWSNKLTDAVLSRFHEGPLVMRHIEMELEGIGGFDVVRIKILPRKALSFLRKTGSQYCCYVRQNVRVVEIPIEQLPELLERRRGA